MREAWDYQGNRVNDFRHLARTVMARLDRIRIGIRPRGRTAFPFLVTALPRSSRRRAMTRERKLPPAMALS